MRDLFKEIKLTPEQCAEGREQLARIVVERTEGGCLPLNASFKRIRGERNRRRHRNPEWRGGNPSRAQIRVRLKQTYGLRRFNPRRLSYALANGGFLAEGSTAKNTCKTRDCIEGSHLMECKRGVR